MEQMNICNKKNIIGLGDYLYNLESAKKVILSYIQSEESYDISRFLKTLNITLDYFCFCVDTIKKNDITLNLEYEKKEKNNRMKSHYNNIIVLKDIAFAIKNGFFMDGTEFNLLEFWKRIPFKNRDFYEQISENMDINPLIKYSPMFITRVNNFTSVLLPEEGKVIANFAKNNKISQSTCITELELRYFCGGERRIIHENKDENGNVTGITDIILNEEDLENMILYMRINDLPFLIQVFQLVEKKYINGDIDIAELKKQNAVKLYKRQLKLVN